MCVSILELFTGAWGLACREAVCVLPCPRRKSDRKANNGGIRRQQVSGTYGHLEAVGAGEDWNPRWVHPGGNVNRHRKNNWASWIMECLLANGCQANANEERCSVWSEQDR